MLSVIRRKFTCSIISNIEDFYDSYCDLGKFQEVVYYKGLGYSSRLRGDKAYPKCSFKQKYEIIGEVFLKNVFFEMIRCQSGSFVMGHEDQDDNKPRSEVIERSFVLGQTEVTQELYEAVMGINPSENGNKPQNPVERVSFYDAVDFCNKLSELQGLKKCYKLSNASSLDASGKDQKRTMSADVLWDRSANGYRLPTEKEWEYAAKAGTQNQWSGTDEMDNLRLYATYEDNAMKTNTVAYWRPNTWGFFDMSGNVYEWCWDIDGFAKSKLEEMRVIRGGCMRSDENDIKVSCRSRDKASGQTLKVGFRLCRTVV